VAPSGWQNVTSIYGTLSGHYVRFGTASLFVANGSAHGHTSSGTSSTMTVPNSVTMSTMEDRITNTARNHTHSYDIDIQDNPMSDWEMDFVSFNMIKKVSSEENTWDGNDFYAYALYTGAGDPGNDWSVASSYDGKYLKVITDTPTTGTAQNGSHTHTITDSVSGEATPWGGGDDYEVNAARHTHPVVATIAATTPAPSTVTFRLAKKILGKMQDYNEAIDVTYTTGVWTSPVMQIKASTLGRLFWNEDVETGDDVHLHFRSASTEADCLSEAWSDPIDNTNGVDLSIYLTANICVQFMIQFDAVDTMVTNPRVYFADGFLVKFLYSQAAVVAETSVEFIYSIGYRNFDMPMVDKIHNKIGTVHEGAYGSFSLLWETENSNDEFVISLYSNPEKWSSFFQDTAMGEKMNITIYKNDLNDFKIKEINGIFTPQPLLI